MHPDPLDVAQAMLDAEGTGPLWGIQIDGVAEGYARIRMLLRAEMLNGHGIAHGGMVFALADSACAYAANSRNALSVTQQASVQFLGQAHEGDWLVAEAIELAVVGRMASYRVVVRIDGGATVAEFSGLTRQLSGAVIKFDDEG